MSLSFAFASDPEQETILSQQGLLPLAQTGYWASRDLLQAEKDFFQSVRFFQNNVSPLQFSGDWLETQTQQLIANRKSKIDEAELSEQLRAVSDLFDRSALLSVITGPPGAAKSTIASLWMQVARAQYPAMPVILVTQEKTALDRLYEKIGFDGACAWTIDIALQRDWPRGAAIIFDEAGLLSTDTLSKLVQRAQKSGAVKLILIGDDKQLVPDAPGQPFRWICLQEKTDRVTLTQSFRQKNPVLRHAVRALYEGAIDTALAAIPCTFSQPEELLGAIRTRLEQAVPDKTFVIVHGPAFVTERLRVLCPGFRIFSLAASQGLAMDRVLFVLAQEINMAELLVGCSRQRFDLDVFVDAGIYASKENLAAQVGPYPESLMALDIIAGDQILDIINQA